MLQTEMDERFWDAAEVGWFSVDELRELTTAPGLVAALDEWGVL